jgi:predicted Zn-dependent protease
MTKKRLLSPSLVLILLLATAAITPSQTGSANKRRVRVAAQSAAVIYFVPLGDIQPLSLEELAIFYRRKFGLTIKTLPALQLETASVDPERRQLIAEELIESMKRRSARLASNPRVILIGITEYDMYIRKYRWRFGFTYRAEDRFAVVSSARMNPLNLGESPDPALLQTRLRKVITKNIGILYFHLPQNNNPRSVLYNSILGIEELDQVGEEF